MRRSVNYLLRTIVAWLFTLSWTRDWAAMHVSAKDIPRADAYLILAVSAVGWYYLVRGVIAMAKGD